MKTPSSLACGRGVAALAFAFTSLCATPLAFAADDDDKLSSEDKSLFGNHIGFIAIEPSILSGTAPSTTVVSTPPSAQNPNPQSVTTGGESFSLWRANVTFHIGGYMLQTMFKTMLGLEFRAQAGYGSSYAKPKEQADDSFNLGMQLISSYALFRWKGGVPGRVVFTPGIGFVVGGGDPYVGGYAYANLGARLVLHPGKDLDVRVGYNYIPNVTADVDLSDHQFELGLNYKSLALGARLQLTHIAPVASPSVTETSLGGFVGIAL